jgi:hypothetical protein
MILGDKPLISEVVLSQCSPVAPRASSTVRVASLATVDLWAELERHCSGEDDRITIERQRERRHNLNGYFGAVDTTLVRQDARTPTSTVGSGGDCMVLAPHHHMVVCPRKFQPHLLEKYDKSVNPTEFLHIYSTSILAVGGNEVIMANYFSVALIDTAWSWLMNLPEGFLTSWAELCCQFTTNLERAYAH